MPAGGIALAGILHKLPRLHFLDVSYCYIGDSGVSKLALALQDSLQTLSLYANSITEEGGEVFMQVMDTSNFSLLHCSLGENPITAHQINVISQSLAFNNNYRALKVKNAQYPLFGHNLMLEYLQRWARNDPFVARRLPLCLERATDPMEEKVREQMLTDGELNLKSISDFRIPTTGIAERKQALRNCR